MTDGREKNAKIACALSIDAEISYLGWPWTALYWIIHMVIIKPIIIMSPFTNLEIYNLE